MGERGEPLSVRLVHGNYRDQVVSEPAHFARGSSSNVVSYAAIT